MTLDFVAVSGVLPDGFLIPPLAYVAIVIALTVTVLVLLYGLRPTVTQGTIIAFTPWMITGSALHVLHVLGAFDPIVDPFFGTPSVYVTTFVLAGSCWAALMATSTTRWAQTRVNRRLGLIGTGVALVSIGYVLWVGAVAGTITLLWPLVAVVLSIAVWAVAWLLLSLRYTGIVAKTRIVGALVVFSHVFDGVTTAIGVDVLGVHERSPLPRAIMDLAATLPTADIIGAGWLFVVVKLAISMIIVGLFAEYVEESPTEALLLLGIIVAVGLGPAVHNLLLFMVGG